jgi:hypothetical protein
METITKTMPQENRKELPEIYCLPTISDPDSPLYGKLERRFWRYYMAPFGRGFFFDPKDPYDDLVTIIWGPRGGGKTSTGVGINIVDGMMKGIPVVSNIPIAWVAEDAHHQQYLVKSIPFEIEKFEQGDTSFRYKRLLLDEGNYQADRLRSTSNNNMGVVDILQQARKFRMNVTFCTINWQWIDPRITGSLADLIIECNDLFYKPYGKKHKLEKGVRIAWDILDQSGKKSGRQNTPLVSTTFYGKAFWGSFDTEHFVDPRKARQKRAGYNNTAPKILPGPDGEPMELPEWETSIKFRVAALAQSERKEWAARELHDTLGAENLSMKQRIGTLLRSMPGVQIKDGRHGAIYNLSNVEPMRA